MGIFKTEKCPICGVPTGVFSKSSAKYDGAFVCQTCTKKLVSNGIVLFRLNKYPIEELKNIVGISHKSEEEHQKELDAFTATKKIGNYIYFDNDHKKYAIVKTSLTGKVVDMQIYDYSSIIDFELLEDGNSIEKGGIGRALVGGALFGGVGAIVGGNTGHKHKRTCSKLQIKITQNDISIPAIYVDFISTETKKTSSIYTTAYQFAQEAMSVLNIITNDLNKNTTNTNSNADEIKKFKELLDEGIITQEEFDKKKKELLGI